VPEQHDEEEIGMTLDHLAEASVHDGPPGTAPAPEPSGRGSAPAEPGAARSAPAEPGAASSAPAAPGAARPAPVLELVGIGKRYGGNEVVHSVNLAVEEGELLTLLGPSGSGKTTILKLVAGFTDITSGTIYLRGRDISEVSPAERGIGMVFQNYALFPHMTVGENIAYGLKMKKVPKEARAKRVDEMLELVGLPGLSERLPRQLSGGQQQRVALARALAFRPSLLLMDEPLGALDRELRERMMVELRRIHQEVGVTALYVTHDREEALTLSDRIGIMRDGVLEGVGTPSNLMNMPPTRFIAGFFGGHALLPASVLTPLDSEGAVQVRCLGQDVSVRTPAALAVGAEVAVAVPPGAISVAPRGRHVLGIDVEVGERLDLGDRMRVTCEVLGESGGRIGVFLRLSVERGSAPAELERGRRQRVYADAAQLALVT
jgi:ABC-type Fe3+/spermidine/putrescine transport system ATPase subunit